ncbi:MAG: ATP-binding protein [Desulfosoma sp.]
MILSVRDTGHGMSPEVMERISEPYFTTKEVGEGTGLGLSVVHGIVRSLGRTINVESRPGLGSLFRVFLPASPQDRAVCSTDRTVGTLMRGTERLVVVDDAVMLVHLTKNLLENLGYTVKGFSDAEEALKYLKENVFHTDLLITDLTMPKLTVEKLAEAVWELRPDLPVVLTSRYGEGLLQKKGLIKGFASFLKKAVHIRGSFHDGWIFPWRSATPLSLRNRAPQVQGS